MRRAMAAVPVHDGVIARRGRTLRRPFEASETRVPARQATCRSTSRLARLQTPHDPPQDTPPRLSYSVTTRMNTSASARATASSATS